MALPLHNIRPAGGGGPDWIRPLWTDFSYFSHQLEGIHWMLQKELVGTLVSSKNGDTSTIYGGFQCDDMGLGKTIQITSVIVNHIRSYTLVIAPIAMIQTWSAILQKVGCAVYEVNTKLDDPWVLMNPNSPVPRHFIKCRPSVYISNYEKLYFNPSLFTRNWDRVVLDEAHKIRNGDGDIARYARRLSAPIRWVVTGTPLVNSLKDIVSLLAFIGVPCSPLWRWEPRFIPILPLLVLHRSLDSLRTDIPDAPPSPVIHDMLLPFTTKDEEDFYFGVQGVTSDIPTYSNDFLTSAQAFKLLLRLRQISVHPQVYINAKRRELSSYDRPDWVLSSTKFDAIRNILLHDSPHIPSIHIPSIPNNTCHKYIIFCQFNDEIALLRTFLLNEQLVDVDNILVYTGSMTQAERTAVLTRSKLTTQTTVLLLQLHAGGVGLNLQEYDRILFISPWWTSALIHQAIARAVRIGQTRIVHIFHLQLAAEAASDTINIDTLINDKALYKYDLLKRFFVACEPIPTQTQTQTQTQTPMQIPTPTQIIQH